MKHYIWVFEGSWWLLTTYFEHFAFSDNIVIECDVGVFRGGFEIERDGETTADWNRKKNQRKWETNGYCNAFNEFIPILGRTQLWNKSRQ